MKIQQLKVVTGLTDVKGNWFSDLFALYIENIEYHNVNISESDFARILSSQEYEIFSRLLENIGEVNTKDDIAKIIWGDDWIDKYSEWTIEKTISNIRRKVGGKYVIKSVYGKGYRLIKNK